MSKGKIIGIIVAIVVVAGIAGGGAYYYYNHNSSTQAVQTQAVGAVTTSQNPVAQVKEADQQMVKADKLQEQQDTSAEKVSNDNAAKYTDQANAEQQAAQKANQEAQKANQSSQNQAQAKTDEANAVKDAAQAKIDQDNAAKAKAAAAAEQAAATKQAQNAQNAQNAEKQVSSATAAVGPTNTAIVPNGNIITSAKSYAVPANEVNQMVNGKYPGNQKEIFLTFDDGPSAVNTPKILNTLKQYGVHATFFVLGSEIQSQADKNIIKDEIMDGNAIADHSYSHSYTKLYPGNSVNVSAFMNEFNATNDILRNILGSNFNARVVRMPGGYMSRVYYHDKNLPALNSAFANAGITSVDWNAETGDATGKAYSPSQLVQNAINETKGHNHIVLLMHDIKSNTAAALPQLIQYYKSQGYAFKVISNTGIN
ncbi:MAG: polysaccharide deacetylase family protein [Sarcina sp.]